MKELKLDDFLNYKFLSSLKYNPSGTSAAFVVGKADEKNNDYRYNLYLYKDGKFTQLTSGGKEGSFIWEDDDNILFPANRSKAEQETAQNGIIETNYYRIAIDGGEAEFAFRLPIAGSLAEKLEDGRWIVEGAIDLKYPDYHLLSEEEKQKIADDRKQNKDYEILTEAPFYGNGSGFNCGKRAGLFLYDPKNNQLERITGGKNSCGDPLVKDNFIYYISINTKVKEGKIFQSSIYRYSLTDKSTQQITNPQKYSVESLIKFGSAILALADEVNPDNDYKITPDAQLYLFDGQSLTFYQANDDSWGNSTSSDCRLGASRSYKSIEDGIVFIKTIRNRAILTKLSLDGTWSNLIDKEGSIDDFDINPQGEILTIGMYGTKLQEIYNGHLEQLSSFNEDVLKDVYLADYQKMTVPSCGWDIDGWVLLPKDYDPSKKYPAILDIHGGPRTVYGEVFEHEMQLWANRGFFVIFCNPVGGSGRGVKFADISGRYGTIDYENIMDFLDAVLVKYPQIDPKRIGETGGSYGGYMSNWINGHTNRFAAIATQRAITNWISFYGVSDIGFFFVKGQNQADIYSEEKLALAWQQSPLKYVNNMVTPMLFIHSDEDYRCPLEQDLQLFTALQEKGVESRMVIFHGENHELSRSGKPLHRIKRLTEITNWLTEHTLEK